MNAWEANAKAGAAVRVINPLSILCGMVGKIVENGVGALGSRSTWCLVRLEDDDISSNPEVPWRLELKDLEVVTSESNGLGEDGK